LTTIPEAGWPFRANTAFLRRVKCTASEFELAKVDQLRGTVETLRTRIAASPVRSGAVRACISGISVRPPSLVQPGFHRLPLPFGRESDTHGAVIEAPICDSAYRPWLPLLPRRWSARGLQGISFPWKFEPLPVLPQSATSRGWLSSGETSLKPPAQQRADDCEPGFPRLRGSYWRVILLWTDGFSVTAMSAAARLASSSHSFGFQSNLS